MKRRFNSGPMGLYVEMKSNCFGAPTGAITGDTFGHSTRLGAAC